MKIAVCDDERVITNEIVELIKMKHPKADVMSFSSGEEMLKAEQNFSIYFLDIDMAGLSGIEIAKEIRARQAQESKSIIIFVTAYREYMEDAFDVNAFHYLVKPIKKEKFFGVLDRVWKDAAALEENSKKKILIKSSGISKNVFLKDIFYIESSNKKVVFHTIEGSFEVYTKMEVLEKELGEYFYRCHRCYLVNMEKIENYNSNTIQLINGEKLILAQKKYPEFVKAFMCYAKKGGIVNV